MKSEIMGEVLLIATPHLFEGKAEQVGLVERLENIALKKGYKKPFQIIHKRNFKLSDYPGIKAVVSDDPTRLGKDFSTIQKVILEVLNSRVDLVILDFLELTSEDEGQRDVSFICRNFFSEVMGVQQRLKSKRIKESLWKASIGFTVGRHSISEEIRGIVLREAEKTSGIRPLARCLKNQGIEISRSSVARILKGKKR